MLINWSRTITGKANLFMPYGLERIPVWGLKYHLKSQQSIPGSEGNEFYGILSFRFIQEPLPVSIHRFLCYTHFAADGLTGIAFLKPMKELGLAGAYSPIINRLMAMWWMPSLGLSFPWRRRWRSRLRSQGNRTKHAAWFSKACRPILLRMLNNPTRHTEWFYNAWGVILPHMQSDSTRR